MAELEFHPASGIFPLLEGALFEEFKAAIKRDGLKHRIVTLDGKILDGRNRYRACLVVRVEPRFTEYTGDQDPVDFVFTENADRRHLSPAQWALVGARRRPFDEVKAKERQRQSEGRGKKKVSSKDDTFSPPRKAGERGLASEYAGEKVGVSAASIDRARVVLEHGCQELIDAVDSGAVAIAPAAQVAGNVPKGKQKELVSEGPAAVREQASKLSAKKKPRRKNRPAAELVDAIKKDIDRLAAFVKEAEKGLVAQRETAVTNLRLAKKYVSATSTFFT